MIHKRMRRAVVALLAAAVVAVMMAGPAAATPDDGEVTAGTITIADFDPIEIGNPGEAPPCDLPNGPASTTISVEFNGGSGSTSIEGIDAPWGAIELDTNEWYAFQLGVFPAFNAGSIAGAAIETEATLSATIAPINSPQENEPCDIDEPVCVAVAVWSDQVEGSESLTGSWNGVSAQPPGDATGLDGTGLVLTTVVEEPNCDTEVAGQLHGQPAVIDNLTVEF